MLLVESSNAQNNNFSEIKFSLERFLLLQKLKPVSRRLTRFFCDQESVYVNNCVLGQLYHLT